MKNQKGRIRVVSTIVTLMLMVALVKSFGIYKANYFNDFEKAIRDEQEKPKFMRDYKVKYSKSGSYSIENTEYGDAAFYKEIEVQPNTPYKITCMVKTENIEREDSSKDSGATIGILDGTEFSEAIYGTNDWQEVEYMFNSKNRTSVKIAFRLGGNQGKCKGKVWFSDFKVEKGIEEDRTEWKMGCFILKQVDVNINGERYKLEITNEDIENVKQNMERYKNDCYRFSNKKMTVDYEIITIDTPVTSISYSPEQGYYFEYNDIKDLVYDIAKEKQFDHIFAVVRMENDNGSMSIPIKDNWIGLGGMDMYGIGYSLIRINRRANSYTYKYGITNQSPEEVYLHEFLHTLERNNMEYGKQTPELHSYEKYGYSEKLTFGLNDWYQDYMRKNILNRTTRDMEGLDESVYKTQPPNSNCFTYPIEIEFNIEPQNIIEEILTIFKTLGRKFQ